jgi:hypothetical protein
MNIFKNLLFQNQPAKFNQTWYKLSLGEGKSSCFFFSNEGPGSLQRRDNHKNVNMG